MTYYPNNLYQSYPYPQFQNYNQVLPQQTYNLSGKMVDGIDVVKATDIPFGGYSIFPKGDLTEIYIKSWNDNGTTKIITYKPFTENEEKHTLEILIDKMEKMEKKLDDLLIKKTPTIESVSATNTKKEMKSSVY